MPPFNLSDYDFKMFKDLIHKECGICFNFINKTVLETRLMDALKSNSMDNLRDFYSLISLDNQKLIEFIDDVTTNLTKFFRIEKHFEVLKNDVLPSIIEDKLKHKLKNISIWSAGCSTGEEPYSIAITCLETPKIENFNVRIYASDISLKSLVKAKEGTYDGPRVLSIPDHYLEKYFDKFDDKYVAKRKIKAPITFDYHNLMYNGTQNNIDIIFCRNVLIYFDEQGQTSTIQRFYDVLGEKGYLFIGHSESLFGFNTKFKYESIKNTAVYVKK